jgi:hypothetical protein
MTSGLRHGDSLHQHERTAVSKSIVRAAARYPHGRYVEMKHQLRDYITMLKTNFLKASGIAAMLVFITVAGCASSHVIVGKVRPPISPALVQIYVHPPAGRYEEVALLDSSSKGAFAFSAQGKTDAVMERLKEEAAKLGANGILLNGVGDQAAGSVGSGFGTATASGHSATGFGIGSSATLFQKTGNGMAIYVEPDQVAAR